MHRFTQIKRCTPYFVKYNNRLSSPPLMIQRSYATTPPPNHSNNTSDANVNQLMMEYYLNAIEAQKEEREKKKQEKEEAEKKKQEQSRWGFKWKNFVFSSSTVTAVVAYLIYQQSFQPIADMRKTFSGIVSPTTPSALEVRLESEKQRLRDELSKLENKQILMVIAPNRAGKSTLVESVLSESEYEVCQVKLKGASGGDQLMSRLRICFGLEETAIEAAIRKVLAIGDFGQKKEKQQNQLVDIASEVEKRLRINIINMFNRKRVILVDGVSHFVYSLD
jgi:acyl-CoA hydrolase